MQSKNIEGIRFGNLIVIKKIGITKSRNTIWECRCDCGNKTETNVSKLINGSAKTCGCKINRLIDIAGQKYGRLLAIKRLTSEIKGRSYWLFKCECGKEKKIRLDQVVGGLVKSCGCLHKEKVSSHGMTNTRFYKIWNGMNQRCLCSKSVNYKNYGGRGISVCKNWKKFENFMNDMYKSYLGHMSKFGVRQTTIDRINNDKNYCLENCRWATYMEQANNKRNSRKECYV